MNKISKDNIETEAWIGGTNRQLSEGSRVGGLNEK